MVKHLHRANYGLFLDESEFPPMPTISEKAEEYEDESVKSNEEHSLVKSNSHQMEESVPPEKPAEYNQQQSVVKPLKQPTFGPSIKPRGGVRRAEVNEIVPEKASHVAVISYRLNLSAAEKIVFSTGETYCRAIKQYGLYNNTWGFKHPYPDVIVQHIESIGANGVHLDEALTFRLQYAILQIAFRICGKGIVLNRAYSPKILDIEKSKPDRLIFSRTLKAFINTLVDGAITLNEA